jgi:uncharacterized protein YciI
MPTASARTAHEAYLTKITSDTHAWVVFDSNQVPDSGGTLLMDAANKAEVEAIALQDPAVREKVFEFEVLGD